MEHTHEELCGILNEQAGKLLWSDLEKHFARGVIIKIGSEMDLVEVAASIVEDNKVAMAAWMNEVKVSNADEKDAADWLKRQPEFWAVVVAPWVVVQEIV